MENNKLARPNTTQAAVEKVILQGDLRSLSAVERVQYSIALCKSLGLNPLTNPIDYIDNPRGKLTAYVNSVGMAQIRRIHNISTKVTDRQTDKENMHYVTAIATEANGRSEETTAIVALVDKFGKALCGQKKADKMMVAETKAKRRATLALVGIPWADANGSNIRSSNVYDPPRDILPTDDIQVEF